ncbi:MAG: hypothetical protein HKN23_15730 [Verrucomicrobiales bacterium]|nr:hypothetical protein [Verrucomicrobiales bacterium]
MERPPITAAGRICSVEKSRHVYRVRMENGYEAYAVVRKAGPHPPEEIDDESLVSSWHQVTVEFSPFDMSRCKIAEFH